MLGLCAYCAMVPAERYCAAMRSCMRCAVYVCVHMRACIACARALRGCVRIRACVRVCAYVCVRMYVCVCVHVHCMRGVVCACGGMFVYAMGGT